MGSHEGGRVVQVGANTEVNLLRKSEQFVLLEHQEAYARVPPELVRIVSVSEESAPAADEDRLFAEALQRRRDIEEEQKSLWGLGARTVSGDVLSVLEDGILLTLAGSESRIIKVVTSKDVVDGDKFKVMAMPLGTTFTYTAANGGAITVRVWRDLEAP